jgi:signal transduction histidine kinase
LFAKFQTWKGVIYVVITSALLFYLLLLYNRKRKAYIKMIENALNKAEHANNLKSTFLANLSHELRTPMNAINGFSVLLGKKDLNNEQVDRYHGFIKNASENLLNIVENIVLISKIQEKQINLNYQEFNIRSLIDSINENYNKRQSDSKKYVIISHVDPSKKITTDIEKLIQIIEIISINSVDKIGEGELIMKINDDEHSFSFSFFWEKSMFSNRENIFRYESKLESVPFESFGLDIVNGLTEILNGKIKAYLLEDKTYYFVLTLPKKLKINESEL